MGDDVAKLQALPGGAAANVTSHLRTGRYAVSTVGFDPNLQLIGSDPYASSSYTGLWVPSDPTTTPQGRYLFLLARSGFQFGERVRLVGIKQFASLTARVDTVDGPAPSFFELPIHTPTWRFWNGGNISWHVRLVHKTRRPTRNPLNADSLIYQDAPGPALLYDSLAPYVPPNAGRPPGDPIPFCDLGNFHDLRYPWRDSQSELELNIPLPPAFDVAIYASVWQHNPSAGLPALTDLQVATMSPEDQFAWRFAGDNLETGGLGCQYGRIAAQLIFEEEIGQP